MLRSTSRASKAVYRKSDLWSYSCTGKPKIRWVREFNFFLLVSFMKDMMRYSTCLPLELLLSVTQSKRGEFEINIDVSACFSAYQIWPYLRASVQH